MDKVELRGCSKSSLMSLRATVRSEAISLFKPNLPGWPRRFAFRHEGFEHPPDLPSVLHAIVRVDAGSVLQGGELWVVPN